MEKSNAAAIVAIILSGLIGGGVTSAVLLTWRNHEIVNGSPIVLSNKLYRCTEKAWPE